MNIDEQRKKIDKGILDILKTQIGAIPNDKTDNCYEIQPYWKGLLKCELLKFLSQNNVMIVDPEGVIVSRGTYHFDKEVNLPVQVYPLEGE